MCVSINCESNTTVEGVRIPQADEPPISEGVKKALQGVADVFSTQTGTMTFPNCDVYRGEFKDGRIHGYGHYTFADGAQFIGDFNNNVRYGKHIFLDGGTFEGYCVNGQEQGNGQRIFANGDQYTGEFKDGCFHGMGEYLCANGDLYFGNFSHNVQCGQAKVVYANGNVYQGNFENGLAHGQGTKWYSNGCVYSGDFANGLKHGIGTLTASNGTIYIGEFANNHIQGYGQRRFVAGEMYAGQFENWNMQGRGTYSSNGAQFTGDFQNNTVTGIGFDNISDHLFIQLLLGKGAAPTGYGIGILADYLIKKGMTEEGKALQSAYEMLIHYDNSIYIKLKAKENCLLSYGCPYHAVGLHLKPDPDEEFVICEIYNSSAFERHQRDSVSGKVETLWRAKVPTSSLTPRVIEELLNYQTFEDIDEAYQKIESLSGFQKIETDKPIWQAPQKGRNCTLEWAFAYLKQTLGAEKYREMRTTLFADIIAQMDEAPESLHKVTDPQIKAHLQKILFTKIDHRTPYSNKSE